MPPISVIGFGCSAVGGRVGRRASLRALEEAFERGVTLFDTARSYGYGDSEEIVGAFARGRRDQIVIATKAGITSLRSSRVMRAAKAVARGVFQVFPGLRRRAQGALGRNQTTGDYSPRELRQSLEASLKALGTGYVDLFFLHACPGEVVERPEVREALDAFVREGLVRRYGVSSDVDVARRAHERWGDDIAVQYGWDAAARPDAPPGPPSLRVANRVLGGGELLSRVADVVRRELPGRRPERGALAFLLGQATTFGGDVALISMASQGHVQSNLDAFLEERLEPEEIARVLSSLRGM